MTLAEAAMEILTERKIVGVMWGDITLVHDIVDRAGGEHHGPRTCKLVLDALDRSPIFKKYHVLIGGRWVRDFRPAPSPTLAPAVSHCPANPPNSAILK